jgi:hypothetical protein
MAGPVSRAARREGWRWRAVAGCLARVGRSACAGILGCGVAWGVAQAVPATDAAADAQPGGIIGTWAGVASAERMVFLPGGYLRTCFAGKQRGNAAMGQWRRLGPGRYAVEFTHVAASDCSRPPQPIRQHPVSIQGLVMISRGELALHVSGEFPPDLYRPLNRGVR